MHNIVADQTPPQVLATIKPLHSLASAVTLGVSEPVLLLDGNTSPHLFQVKPSHIRSVENADVIVWAGEGVERFLPPMISKFNDDAQVLAMADHAGVKYLARDKHSEHDHEHGAVDYHLWLDPANAIGLVNALADELARLDPGNGAQYQGNAINFVHQLTSTTEEIKITLSEAQGKHYLIYHDSLQYLEKAFGLGEAIIVAPQPQVQAGGRRLRALHDALSEDQIGCLISEPQFRSPVVATLAEDLGVQPATIDPLGTDLTSGADLYSQWLLGVATTLADCLASTNADQ